MPLRKNHADPSLQSLEAFEMEVAHESSRLLEEPPLDCDSKLFHTDEATNPFRGTGGRRKKLKKQSLDYVLRSGLAGGLAGCAAKTIVGPLDRVKILFQASNPQFAKYTGSWFGVMTAMRDINRQDGIRGLFRGHSATLLRVFPYAGIKFLAYEQFRAVIIPTKDLETPGRRFLAGSLAGITSVFFTYPLEVIRVRLAFDTKKDSRSSLSRICRKIYNEHPRPAPAPAVGSSSAVPGAEVTNIATAAIERTAPRTGLINFYRGFSPTLLGMLPYAGMSFLTHDTIGDWLRDPSVAKYTVIPSTLAPTTASGAKYSEQEVGHPLLTELGVDEHHRRRKQQQSQHHDDNTYHVPRRSQLTAPAELTAGAIAGLVSQTASYPFEVVRRRMQVGGAVGDGHRMTIAETAKKIMRERGIWGFWVGLSIGYVKVVPMVATSFFVYERCKWWLGIES